MSAKQLDFVIKECRIFESGCSLMRLKPADGAELPDCRPGQFVQVLTKCQDVFLRRPISICDVFNGELTLFIKPVGKGSEWLVSQPIGTKLNLITPLGTGFSIDGDVNGKKILLVGGGVGCAPLVYLSKVLSNIGANVTVAIGGRTKRDVEGLEDLYSGANPTAFSTEDGSYGEKGLITQNSVFSRKYDRIYCCGPTPMMKAIARIAVEKEIWCEVSLENMMACGLGACLCCVQETSDNGNVCVCTEGPVFNINRLTSWI